MPCYVAIEKDTMSVSPEILIEDALSLIREKNIPALAVIDDEGELIGIFSIKSLLSNIIPISIAMSEGVQLDVKIEAAPGVAKRMRAMFPLSVTEGIDRKYTTVEADAPIWEGVTKITKYGGPLVVIDKDKKFKGFITYESLTIALENTEQTDS